jgi:hypothetical protein
LPERIAATGASNAVVDEENARTETDEAEKSQETQRRFSRGYCTSKHKQSEAPEHCEKCGNESTVQVISDVHGGLTFDMRGGPKGAKRPLERPLDGRVRPLG